MWCACVCTNMCVYIHKCILLSTYLHVHIIHSHVINAYNICNILYTYVYVATQNSSVNVCLV